tara:strand:- start:913 stop:1053 length:141 start_codon:yes stop_codon:yes gene_type:complete
MAFGGPDIIRQLSDIRQLLEGGGAPHSASGPSPGLVLDAAGAEALP